MILKRKSLLSRWAFWPERFWDEGVNSETTLCSFFWRAFVGIPLFTALAIVFMTATSVIWGPVWISQKITQGRLFGERIHGHFDRVAQRRAEAPKDRSLFAIWFRSMLAIVHGKVCPIIKVENDDEERFAD